MKANFLTGPVALRPEVLAALAIAPFSHRDPQFLELMTQSRAALKRMVNASNVALLVGSGTLANDVVAAQLKQTVVPGLILSNGEFGERLIDHARRWSIPCAVLKRPWGEPFDWDHVRSLARRHRTHWIWAVLTETSTGIDNSLTELLAVSASVGADLCLDAISAVGLMPVDLQRVHFATAVSGKGLAAAPGLAAVFYRGRPASSSRLPRYLDLASYETADSVPFTHSSNLLAALERSLTLTRWPEKFDSVRRKSAGLRTALRAHGLPPLAPDSHAAPGIVTIEIPRTVRADAVARALGRKGILVGYQSTYLRDRNWLQICLMGQISGPALRTLPRMLASLVADPANLD